MFERSITVPATQHVLEQRAGQPTRVLPAGRHRRRARATYAVVDARSRLDLVAPQEVLSADGVSLKVTATVDWRVVDPVAFTERATEPFAAVYLATQVTLREAVVTQDSDTAVRAGRGAASAAATTAAQSAGGTVGIEVREVVVKDVILPPELRAAYAELVTGRQRALVQLEAARAETAALRSLANGAKLLDEHPALARMRLVQALPTGSTVELRNLGES